MNIKDLLQLTVDRGASDLHIVSGHPPMIRIHGSLIVIPGESTLSPEIVDKYLEDSMTSEQLKTLKENKEIDFSLSFSSRARFRVNAYTQKKTYAIAYRSIPLAIPTVDSLGLPAIMHDLISLRQGLILVTGPTGHGKSTSIAAMLDEINKTRASHIITIEDPVEFIFDPVQSIISQREIGADTNGWQIALRSALREDPDVVLVGEMRDYETIAAALTIAETGHLVFATLHTNSAAQTIDRIVDVFPDEQQSQVKLQLSNTLQAIISQRLVPSLDGTRVVAAEVLTATTAIKTEIREGKTHQIDSVIQTSSADGMISLESSLARLVREGKITVEIAKSFATRPEQLMRLIR